MVILKQTISRGILTMFLIALLMIFSACNIDTINNELTSNKDTDRIDIVTIEEQVVSENGANNHLSISTDDLEKIIVTRVVDGDTIVIEGNRKVRLILVNTPESVHSDESKNTEFGKIASEYTTNILLNKTVYLEKDVSDTDKYGRLLRYVYLEDGTFFNLLLVKEGYAKMAKYPPDIKYMNLISEAEQFARENKKGFWESYYLKDLKK